MKFILQNYNEFKNHVRWHDYVSIIVNEFPVILVRRYDWMDEDPVTSTWLIQIFGVKI